MGFAGEVPQARSDTAPDPAAWVDRHADALFRYAMLRLRNAELAEDMVQECFLAALDGRDRFSGHSAERTWLIGILKRKVIDHFRRKAREKPAEDRELTEIANPDSFNAKGFWKDTPGRWRGDPADLLEDREFWVVFEQCLAGLSPRLAEAFVLRELDQMGSEDVCQVLGITPTNLWARLHRARLGLRQCLENNWFSRRK